MSDEAETDQPAKERAPTNWTLIAQIATAIGISVGGGLGKGAYDDLREKLVEQRVETTELRKSIEALDDKADATRSELAEAQRERSAIRERLSKLEAQHAAARRRRR